MVATLYDNIEIVDYLLLNKKVNINLKDVNNYFISYYFFSLQEIQFCT